MPRIPRGQISGTCYHVINRGNGQAQVFGKPADYQAFLDLIGLASARTPMRVLGCCLMPNHFHLVLWPTQPELMSVWMQWLMTSHVRRYHRHHQTSGHVWQGRFKSFPIQRDSAHLLTVLRYVEANPLRARLAPRAEQWPWSSLHWWGKADRPAWLTDWPVARPERWAERVNQAMAQRELDSVRMSLARGRPFGSPAWTARIAAASGLESTLRPRGRPRKRGQATF